MRTARLLVVALAMVLTTAASTPAQHGRGVGLAFAADRNGYPGPLHVLELKDRLRLTPEQERRAQELHVRLVHLRTHLTMREVLTEDQRRVYHAARWTK